MAEITLEFIARQLDRVITENASIRDDLRVLTAITLRVDSTVTGLLTEMHAIHISMNRMNDRIRKLEEAQSTE